MLQFIVEIEASQFERRDAIGPQSIPQAFAIVRQHGDLEVLLWRFAQFAADWAQFSPNFAAQVGFHSPIRLKNGRSGVAQAMHLAGLMRTARQTGLHRTADIWIGITDHGADAKA